MNLLRDPWVPVTGNGAIRRATLREVLCSDAPLKISLRRDDMELAALQLATCLAQVLLPPADAQELRDRVKSPLPGKTYDDAVVAMADWFDLRHPRHPFMQARRVKAKEPTPIQKLFAGLPAGNNHAHFNRSDEVAAVCPACAAIALFHQAVNCPSFGGGFKGSLRGGAPVTTLIQGADLRTTIWLNVLHRPAVEGLCGGDWGKPVWVEPIPRGRRLPISRIGFLRGLFWQPARVELAWEPGTFICAGCGLEAPEACSRFQTEKFSYQLDNDAAQWPHPHGPREWSLKDGRKSERFVSLRKTAPAWTQLSGFLLEHENAKKEGWVPAPVVLQFRQAFRGQRLGLIVGGYRNKQAKILERRHELFSLAAGWGEEMDSVRDCLDQALAIKNILRKKAYGFGKAVGPGGLARLAEDRFYALSEESIHGLLRRMDWKEAGAARERLSETLCGLASRVFDEVTAPYRHRPKGLERYIKARHKLRLELHALRGTA